jgi:hypothetical protein
VVESFTWRNLLAQIIADPSERHRLADKLNINSLTLTRWSSGASTPRLESLHRLVVALPAYEERLRALIMQDVPEFARIDAVFAQTLAEHISPVLYSEILSLWATASPLHRGRKITERLLSALLEQLDEQPVGIIAVIALFTPPLPGKPVRSLHVFMSQVMPHAWKQVVNDMSPYLVGSESLTGYAIQTNRLQSLYTSDLRGISHMRSSLLSAVACPIRAFSRLAGCLYIASKQVDYFLTPQINLIEAYAQLATLALDEHDFFEYEDIALSFLPLREVQAPLMEAVFYQMVHHDGRPDFGKPLTPRQLELELWQLLEQQILDGDTHETPSNREVV